MSHVFQMRRCKHSSNHASEDKPPQISYRFVQTRRLDRHVEHRTPRPINNAQLAPAFAAISSITLDTPHFHTSLLLPQRYLASAAIPNM
jgi:hypothetical protein